MSKADMAKALDMDFSQYSRQEKKGSKLTIEQLKRIADVLQISMDYLLNYNPDASKATILSEIAKNILAEQNEEVVKKKNEEMERLRKALDDAHEVRQNRERTIQNKEQTIGQLKTYIKEKYDDDLSSLNLPE